MEREVAILILVTSVVCVSGHGRLVEPPSRSSMWRFGYPTERNYEDHQLFCGGYEVQWKRNGGRCGICGDAWDSPQPRANEAGGRYGKGILVRKYKEGQVIRATAEITANHLGYFQFKICPNNDTKKVATQKCLDQYPLSLADGPGTKYHIHHRKGHISVNLTLPQGLFCSQCVLQWTYTAGNSWGFCKGKTGRLGCGPQETFRGCADVVISNSDDPLPVPTAAPVSYGHPGRHSWRKYWSNRRRKPACHSVGVWTTVAGMDQWCVNNCLRDYCPPTHCTCD